MNETLRHTEAFEHYYSSGAKRSYDATATEFGVTKGTIYNWAKSFDWHNRIEQRDIENARRLEKKTNDTVVNTKAKYRKIIKALIGKAVSKINNGTLDPDSIQDIERLMKIDLLLIGEATERTESHEYIAEFGTDGNSATD